MTCACLLWKVRTAFAVRIWFLCVRCSLDGAFFFFVAWLIKTVRFIFSPRHFFHLLLSVKRNTIYDLKEILFLKKKNYIKFLAHLSVNFVVFLLTLIVLITCPFLLISIVFSSGRSVFILNFTDGSLGGYLTILTFFLGTSFVLTIF